MNASQYTGRVVVITGASAGIGRACARAFAERGDRLALIARGRAGLEAAAAEARQAGTTAITIEADVADPEAVEAAAERIEDELGPIDVWVNGAVSTVIAPFTEITPEEFRRVTEVSYLGYVYTTRIALRRMLPRGHGTLVHVGSAGAYRGVPLQSAYSGAEHALQGWHEALRCELLASRTAVRSTMVQMPAVNTPQLDWTLSRLPNRGRPVPPVYQPEVAARAVLHAADRPQRREYWVGGSTAAILLANAVAPGLLDRYLARTGLDSQQADRPRRSGDPVNLWKPVDGLEDRGARGRFDDIARDRSLQFWATTHRAPLAAAAVALLLGTGVCARWARSTGAPVRRGRGS
ncbi:SDR family oxidoreductase [Kitasatospora herbaricolor]|uniref:SDR family oxidoreductase n=1 Tax=Kitasatospora herbaricolor TaxID=68217 RepID=A0ABZ1W1J2_9ACTN|nr:SDR family oxidoreductase [Kitasatospora herbaricolor]